MFFAILFLSSNVQAVGMTAQDVHRVVEKTSNDDGSANINYCIYTSTGCFEGDILISSEFENFANYIIYTYQDGRIFLAHYNYDGFGSYYMAEKDSTTDVIGYRGSGHSSSNTTSYYEYSKDDKKWNTIKENQYYKTWYSLGSGMRVYPNNIIYCHNSTVKFCDQYPSNYGDLNSDYVKNAKDYNLLLDNNWYTSPDIKYVTGVRIKINT